MKPSYLACIALLLGSRIPCLAQVPPEKALSTFTVGDGLELALWASEPLFANPTCIDIDHKGRVWVCESVNYRHRLHRRPPNRPEGDRIVILEDSDGDGRADKATTFYQSPEFLAPLGIAVAKEPVGTAYKVYVCHSPDILVFEDRDGDGKADGPPRKLLSGFRGVDHDHGVHGISIGPDGKLYFSVGDQGVSGLIDKHGKKWSTNHTDCQAGTIWRCDPDGKNLELLAHNFRNEYEPAVDSFGAIFVSDNDDDGNQQTRICYVMPGGNYGYWPRGPGESHWHEEQPGIVHKILRTYFGSPTGLACYEGTLLPRKYHGQLLHTDAGPRQLRCYHLRPKGAGYEAEQEILLQSSDNWFRPSDVCVAPDGSILVSDWYDPGVGGHGMGDTGRGRIYRLAPKGYKGSMASRVDLKTDDGIRSALASPALSVRSLAMQTLQGLPPRDALAVLGQAVKQQASPWLRARALWQLSVIARRSNHLASHQALMAALKESTDANSLQLFVRLLKDVYDGTAADFNVADKIALVKHLAPVRREALLALRDIDPVKAKPVIVELARKFDGTDHFYLNAIAIAVGNDAKRREVILADFDEQFPDWDERVANLIWALRPPKVLPRLERQLAETVLSVERRRQIIDILAGSNELQAGRTLLRALGHDLPAGERERIVGHLRKSLPNKWADLRQSQELSATIQAMLRVPDQRLSALALIAAAQDKSGISLAAALADDVRESAQVRQEAIRTIGSIQHPEAVARLERIIQEQKGPIAVEAIVALGSQIPMYREAPGTRAALLRLQAIVLGVRKEPDLRQAGATTLAQTRLGSIWLLDLQEHKRLPDSIQTDVARLLRNSPFQDLRNRALIAFPAPGRMDPRKLPAIASLVAHRGDPERGKQILAQSMRGDLQCLKCHTIRGLGGQVGPDLSMIGKKASRENLFESILQPSKAVADQYIAWLVETKTGLVVTGLLIQETQEFLILRDANGKDFHVQKADIEIRKKSPNSLMPVDLLAFMTQEDLVDVVEYLYAQRTPALSLDFWHIVGPFENGPDDSGLDKVYLPEAAPDLTASYAGKYGPVKWAVVRPGGQSYVDLAAYFGERSNNIVSYLYREFESPVEQEAVLVLGTDDGARLWLNGRKVYSTNLHRAAEPEQDRVAVRLKKGRNSILLKINNGGGPHGFYLTILAGQELSRAEERK